MNSQPEVYFDIDFLHSFLTLHAEISPRVVHPSFQADEQRFIKKAPHFLDTRATFPVGEGKRERRSLTAAFLDSKNNMSRAFSGELTKTPERNSNSATIYYTDLYMLYMTDDDELSSVPGAISHRV